MPGDSFFDKASHELNPADFGRGFYDGAITQPTRALKQLVGQDSGTDAASTHGAPIPAHDTLAAKAGALAGFIVDFTILSKLTGGVVNKVLGETAAETVAGNAAKMFVAGGVYGGVFTPSNPGEDLLTSRLANAGVTGSSFAAMGAVSKALEGNKLITAHTNAFTSKVFTNAIAGGAGGIVEAYGGTAVHQGRLATPAEVLATTGQYALFGAGFGAFDYGINKGMQKAWEIPGVQNKYYEAKWKLREASTEARRTTYEVLNKYNMRHPLQRIGDAVYGTEVAALPRAPLTAENNPVSALQKELPEYFKEVERRETAMESEPDRGKSYHIWDGLKEYRVSFGQRLLELWHGTPEKPGISQYTDAELAAKSRATPEQISEIRKVLTSDMKAENWREESPFLKGLTRLANFEIPGRAENYDILDGLELAKERFYGYDGKTLSSRLSMSRIHHYVDNHYATPPTWMPYEAAPRLSNVFHGTVSRSMPTLFTERQMLSSYELRLRGIGQATGESAGQEFPRRAVSLTRDFNEAYAYHRHSPATLTDFPVVYGIDAKPMSRAYPAGSLEPGELLIDKLRLGSSWFGLRKPEINNIYVPDAEVPHVQNMLRARRIRGVNVVGFNEIPTPEWKPDPSREELEKMLGYLY